MDTIASRLDYLIKKFDVSHKNIEKHTCVSAGNVSNYRLGKVKPSADAIIALSNFFGVTTDWLLKGVGPGPTDPDEQLISDLVASETLETAVQTPDNAAHIPSSALKGTLRNYFFSHAETELKEWVELFENAPVEARPVLLNAAHAIAQSYSNRNPNKALPTSPNTGDDEQAATKSDIA